MPGPQHTHTVGELAAGAIAVLDHLGVQETHVVGASLGGLVAQRLALDQPERVASLVLSGSWASSDRYLRALLRSWAVVAERAHSVDELLTQINLWTRNRHAWNSGTIDTEIAHEERTFPRVAFHLRRDGFIATVASAFEHDDSHRLDAVTAPTLVGADRRGGPADAAGVEPGHAEVLGQCTGVSVPGAFIFTRAAEEKHVVATAGLAREDTSAECG